MGGGTLITVRIILTTGTHDMKGKKILINCSNNSVGQVWISYFQSFQFSSMGCHQKNCSEWDMDPYSREGVKKFRISTKSKREHYFMLGVFKIFLSHVSCSLLFLSCHESYQQIYIWLGVGAQWKTWKRQETHKRKRGIRERDIREKWDRHQSDMEWYTPLETKWISELFVT